MEDTTPFKIDLNNVSLRNRHVLAKASAAQIMRTMMESVNKTDKQETDFQKVLYPWLQKNVVTLSSEFEKMCSYNSETERGVKFANLFTPLSKNTDAGLKKHNRITLSPNTNFGPLLEALEQRVDHIVTKVVPNRYKENESEGDAFSSLVEQLKEFSKVLMGVKADYEKTIAEARKHVDMDNVAQRRKEKREMRRQEKNKDKYNNRKGAKEKVAVAASS